MSQVKDLVDAIDAFVKGTKADGTWNALRASCIMAGWNNLNGALTPLVGPAPTNFNFVSADYNRKTGLKGNGTTKWLNTNRNYNADPLLSQHIAFRVAEQNTIATSVVFGVSGAVSNRTSIGAFGGFWNVRSRNNDPTNIAVSTTVGLIGVSRNLSTEHDARISGTTSNILARPAGAPGSENFGIFASGAGNFWSDMRCNFYSIGEHINLGQLENRVTALVNAIDEAIPVLDTLSVQSAAAYSLRKLRADYAGPAIRVRRSSDNAEQDIGFTAEGDLDTTALLAHVGAGDGFVTTWYDQSGNARNAVREIAAQQPLIVNAGVVETAGAKPAIVFSGGVGALVATSWGAIPQPFILSYVIRAPSPIVVNGHLVNNASGGQNTAEYYAGGTHMRMFAGTPGPQHPMAVNERAVFASVYNGAASIMTKNGVVNGPAAVGGNSLSGIWLNSFSGATFFSNTTFQDFIVFPAALTTADRQTLERDQGQHYGITVA